MRKYNCVMQDDSKDCGICSLLTIIREHNGNLSKEYLRNITATSNSGVNALSLIEAGRKLGFDAKGLYGDIRKLDSRYLPCIAHVILDKNKHFVVIHKIDLKNENIIIADPSRGILKLDIDKFDKISTKNYLIFIPRKKLPLIEEENLIKSEITHFIYKYNKEFIILFIFSLLYTVYSIIVSYNLKLIIDTSIINQSINNLYVVILFLGILYFLKTLLEYLRIKIFNFINHKLDYILLSKSFYHILSLPHLYFKDRTTGDIFSRVRDVVEIRETISNFLMIISIDFLVSLTSFIFLGFISKKLTVIAFVFMLIYSLFIEIYNRYLSIYIEDLKINNALLNSQIIELISANNTIKSLNILEKMKNRFSLIYNKVLVSNHNFLNKENIKFFIEKIILNSLIVIILYIGAKDVIDENLKLSSFITFNTILYFVFEPIKNLTNIKYYFTKSKIILNRLNEMLNIKEERIITDISDIEKIKGDIEIKNLNYRYGSRVVLNKINLLFKEGEKVLIHGKSGCGKSTLGKIISGIIPIERGKISINKKDLNSYNMWNLREDVTYLFQDEYIFTGTLMDNISIKNKCDKKNIKESINNLLLNEIIEKRNSDYLDENGSNLSGGERQRIALARAFTKDSNIFILDESFSQIDVDTERKILTNLFLKYRYKTIIVISHRFDNNDLYDRTLNLEEYGH